MAALTASAGCLPDLADDKALEAHVAAQQDASANDILDDAVNDATCSTDCQDTAGATTDTAAVDAQPQDATTGPDADGPLDILTDGAVINDATTSDGASTDAVSTDIAAADLAGTDATPNDTSTDAGPPDGGPPDSSSNDASSSDTGSNDAGATDTGPIDAGPIDAGPSGACKGPGPGLFVSDWIADNDSLALAGTALKSGRFVHLGRHGKRARARAVDPNGKQAWSIELDTRTALMHDAITLATGDVLAVGQRARTLGGYDPWMVRISATGKVVKAATAKAGDLDSIALSVAYHKGDTVVVAGYTREAWSTTRCALFFAYDVVTGKASSMKKVGSSKSQRLISGIVRAPNGGWVAAGYARATSSPADEDGWLVAISDAGGFGAEAIVKKYAQNRFYDVTTHPNGGFIAVGSTRATLIGPTDVWVVRVDKSLKTTWARSIGEKDGDIGYWVHGDKAGAVDTGEWGTDIAGSASSVFLMRVDNLGNQVWRRSFGSKGRNEAGAIAAVSDGYWLTSTLDAKGSKVTWRALRTDPWGHTTCAQSGACAGWQAAACDDNKPCTADDCSKGACTHKQHKLGASCGGGKSCSSLGNCK